MTDVSLNAPVKPGKFITFEGGEGAGKSTQIKSLKAHLESLGLSVITTREPGGSDGAEIIRDLIVKGDANRWDGMTEALLFQAARRDHLMKVIWPALEQGTWVLCDRFNDSSIAYQGYGHELGVELIETLYEIISNGFKPDLTLWFDLPVEIGLRRTHDRGLFDAAAAEEMRFEQLEFDFHKRLYAGYVALSAKHPERYVNINANQDIEAVTSEMLSKVGRFFKLES